MNYRDESIKKYLDDLSAKLPAPGGGSASAASAALGAALLSMVVNFTIGKPKYAKYDHELKKLLERSEKLRHEFLRLVDLDVVAYKSGNPREAMNVPLMVARLCLEAQKICPKLIKMGNRNLITDVVCAAIFLESAFVSAVFNVEINLKMHKDGVLARKMRSELYKSRKIVHKIRMQTEEKVGKIINARH